jgi:uncharacterized protein
LSKKARNRRQCKRVESTRAKLQKASRLFPPKKAESTQEAIRRGEMLTALQILSEGVTPAKALELGANAIGYTSRIVGRSPNYDLHACRAGCAWCCFIPVAVTPPEALVIAKYLRDHCSSEELSGLQETLAAQAIRIGKLSCIEHGDARLPCAFLRDGHCTVYEARPIRCRSWNSTDREACEVGFHDPRTPVVPVDPYAFEAGMGVQEGLYDGVKQAGLDGARYELHSAILRALEVPDAAERWINGENVFVGCTRGERVSLST